MFSKADIQFENKASLHFIFVSAPAAMSVLELYDGSISVITRSTVPDAETPSVTQRGIMLITDCHTAGVWDDMKGESKRSVQWKWQERENGMNEMNGEKRTEEDRIWWQNKK